MRDSTLMYLALLRLLCCNCGFLLPRGSACPCGHTPECAK